MKAVYSYWDLNKDYRVNKEWYSEEFKWNTLLLSVHNSLKFFDKVEMVTTTHMKKKFEELNIPFTKISTELDELDCNRKLWILGKIKCYSIQDEPFIHIDNDFILYNKPEFKTVLVQEIESFDNIYHKTGYYINLKKSRENFINKPILFDDLNRSVCMGVYGIKDLKFNTIYCNTVLNLISDNIDYLLNQIDVINYGIILEQYVLSCLINQYKLDIKELDINFLHLMENKYTNKYYNYIKQEVSKL